jgi:general secretion pathway protein D
MNNVQRQVLIEATLVEVHLSDQYQAGVDWTRIAGNFSYIQALTAGALGGAPAYTFSYNNPNSSIGNISSTIKLLSQYGQTKILSSPKIMTLNNQTAILKVVNNRVYFSVGVESKAASNVTDTGVNLFSSTTTTEIHTVPEGLVMSLTPHISDNDQVMINVRPTISRIVGFENDPNPLLAENNIVNRIPIVQVREIETVLKVQSGHVAIMGGLMQDETIKSSNALPGVSDAPIFGDLFKYRDDTYTKTELVIFLRPIVIKDASLTGDLHEYRRYLPDSSRLEGDAPTTIPVNLQTLYPHVGQ